MCKEKEISDYRRFTGPAELHKAINTLRGIVAGITTDYTISDDEVNELSHWCVSHVHLAGKHPFSELLPLIESIYQDGVLTSEEKNDIVWLCNNFVSDSDYYDIVTSSLQFLSGLIHGIMADGEISDQEILMLKSWVNSNSFLTGCYPFDEIESLLLTILQDGKVTDDERNILKAFFSNFIDLKTSYNLNSPEMESLKNQYSVAGICSICQEINFEGNTFCFTGQSERATRNEISEIIKSLGGIFGSNVTKKTRYLIVGNAGNPCWAFSCYGRKIEDAISRRKSGQALSIINEVDFWDIVDDLI